ncbi:MAG TPA: DUF6089 family protein [Bacteroidia bacterium]|jgi:hypothetical protein|nr:DUF6089 family protein [Bacteroidia bacterium]
MRKITLLFSFLLIWVFSLKAQFSTEAGLNLGASNYLGDIGGQLQAAKPWLIDMKVQETRWAVGGYFRKKINSRFFVEAQLNWIRICGADSLSTNHGRVGRNLYFRNDIEELSLMADWVFYQITDIGGYYSYKTTFNAYLTGGVSVFHHNPEAMYNGEWVSLQPLQTEGKSYSLIQPGIPVGIGFYYIFQRQFRLGWNLIWTETFTDYLDDVSGNYATQVEGSEAAYMANRTAMVPGMTKGWADNYLPGNKRGDPSNKDSFITTQVSLGYIFKGSNRKIMHRNIFNYRSRSTF